MYVWKPGTVKSLATPSKLKPYRGSLRLVQGVGLVRFQIDPSKSTVVLTWNTVKTKVSPDAKAWNNKDESAENTGDKDAVQTSLTGDPKSKKDFSTFMLL